MSRTLFAWMPDDADLPSSAAAQFASIHTSARRPVLAFDASTAESVYFDGIAPIGLTTPLTLIVKAVMASATSGGVSWDAFVEAVTAGDATDLDSAESFDAANNANTAAVPGTAGYEFETSIPLTNNDGIAAGDRFRIKLTRKVADGADTATGDCYLTAVELRDAA